jgi:AcrR family transcriptional regulator
MSATRQQILQIATALFEQDGYNHTTLAQIADAANANLDEVQALYSCKEQLVLDLYQTLAHDTQYSVEHLAQGHIANRYFEVMEIRITQLQPHYEALAALFAHAILPHGEITTQDISPGKRDALYQAFIQLVEASDDAPAADNGADNLAMLLYTFHFMILVFWMFDRTKDKQATHLMIDFMGDFFKVMRPMMVMPLFSKAMTKLAQIMMLVFGGARLVESDNVPPQVE